MEYPQVEQPKEYRRNLLPHQLTSVFRMENFEKNKGTHLDGVYEIDTDIGIQADITGYGKTSSMLALVIRDEMEWCMTTPYIKEEVHSSVRGLRVRRKTSHQRINCTLIVCSQSIVSQWQKEISLTDLKYYTCKSRKTIEMCDVNLYDIIICTPTMYNRLISKEKGKAWKRFIYDEPGPCHIASMKYIVTGFTWFVTATPDILRWRYNGKCSHYCASLCFGLLENTFFKALQIKNDDEYVKQSWVMPPVENIYHECWQQVCTTIRGLVPLSVEKMIEAGNIRGAISMMGGTETESIVDLIRSRFQEDLNEAEHKILRYTRRNDISQVDVWKARKKRIADNIKSLNQRFINALNGDCNICLHKLQRPILLPCCQNLFCGNCILKWLQQKGTCPICRNHQIDPSQLTYIISPSEGDKHLPARGKTKVDIILNIAKDKHKRIIIFSEEDASFHTIQKHLESESEEIICSEIRGRIKTREKIISLFKQGKIRILFLNSRNNGAGIDLQECTDIVLYHKMSPDIHTQILGRANRIGRKNNLRVHHLTVS